MVFTQEQLALLQTGYGEIAGRCQGLLDAYLSHNYAHEKALEHARHGFARRLKTLARCIENIYMILPPDRVERPTPEERYDAMINLQAFVFNIFGSIHNLAWIWVSEKDVKKPNGSALPPAAVGLSKSNKIVRDSFSQNFQDYIRTRDGWFDNLENFRHALAHRIPLYVPPYIVPAARMPAYLDLEQRMNEAADSGDFGEHDRLSAEQEALGVFQPLMTHSFGEDAKKIVFHSQVLADFNTVDEIGCKLLEELRAAA